MKSNDFVSERAYNIVCKMLGRHEERNEDVAPGQRLEETMKQPCNGPTAASDLVSPPYNDPDLQYFEEASSLRTYVNDDYYFQANSANFDLSSLAMPPNEPPADFLFGQAQMPLFFGDYFSTNFDQGTDYYDLDDYTQHGQQPPQ